jgi:hypothetical protein
MRTWKTAAFGLVMASFTGCSSSGFLEESPPKAYLEASNQLYETKTGTYYYSYSVWWMDESQKNVSNGDASYALVLEVQ